MTQAAATTVNNLTEFHYQEYPDAAPPVLEILGNGDWCLTRTAPDGSVTFIEIIDQKTGEFVSTAKPSDKLMQEIAEQTIEEQQRVLDLLAER